MVEPEARAELTANLENKRDEKLSNSSASDIAKNEESKPDLSISEKKTKEGVQGGNVGNIAGGGIVSSKPYNQILPYNDKDALDLDNYLTEGNRANSPNSRALIVGGGSYNVGFDGFMLQINDAELEALKAKMDSLYNTMKDSLNNTASNK
jgi:hypothetical protein